MLLAGPSRPGVGFRAEVIALGDSATGIVGRAVWTDENGDQIFSELHGNGNSAGRSDCRDDPGRDRALRRCDGDYEFKWQYVLEAEDGAVQGRTNDLKGRVRVGQPPSTPPAEVKP